MSRRAGKFAVIRFDGRINASIVAKNEQVLRNWLTDQGLSCEGTAEVAGHDPPWTPGPLRRNELLIRLDQTSDLN